MSSDKRDGYTTVGDLLLRQGGEWLGAARERVKQRGGNGCDVTWGSNDRLSPPLTIAEVEEIAAVAVAADRNNLRNPLRVERDEAIRERDEARAALSGWRDRVQALAAIMAVADGPMPTREMLDCGYEEAVAVEDEMSETIAKWREEVSGD